MKREIDVICEDCSYKEPHELKYGESFNGTKCPICDGDMVEAED
jgi:NMD protein affecting ribosome stability and mRNA decay